MAKRSVPPPVPDVVAESATARPKAPAQAAARSDPWGFLRAFTNARIALGRAGGSVPTVPLLAFQHAHARARDAVLCELDDRALHAQLVTHGWEALGLRSAALDRSVFIRRPDLGRILCDASIQALRQHPSAAPDVVIVLADGLSAQAVQRHAVPVLAALRAHLDDAGWKVAPVCVVRQGRVAIGDEIGALLSAAQAVVLIGERPGLSSPDSLGIYLTHQPLPGRHNAERNCISNVRPEGLDPATAADKLWYLMREARRLGLSGVRLKEDAPAALEAPSAPAGLAGDPPV